MRSSGYAGVAQLAMHNREHVAVIRPGRSGLVLHTMFYENEVRRDEEYKTDVSGVSEKELQMAGMLVEALATTFDASKYRDTYRDKVEALIEAKLEGEPVIEVPQSAHPPVVNILDALQRSLEAMPKKPASRQEPPGRERKKTRKS